ncbi:hypothetical protein R0K05_22980, partial [Planococcus sp. SIMBA_160]
PGPAAAPNRRRARIGPTDQARNTETRTKARSTVSRTDIAPASETAAPASALSAGADFGEVRDFVELLKPRVMSLVVLSGVAGL